MMLLCVSFLIGACFVFVDASLGTDKQYDQVQVNLNNVPCEVGAQPPCARTLSAFPCDLVPSEMKLPAGASNYYCYSEEKGNLFAACGPTSSSFAVLHLYKQRPDLVELFSGVSADTLTWQSPTATLSGALSNFQMNTAASPSSSGSSSDAPSHSISQNVVFGIVGAVIAVIVLIAILVAVVVHQRKPQVHYESFEDPIRINIDGEPNNPSDDVIDDGTPPPTPPPHDLCLHCQKTQEHVAGLEIRMDKVEGDVEILRQENAGTQQAVTRGFGTINERFEMGQCTCRLHD